MDLYDVGRVMHSSIGAVALIAFWAAALATKGSRLHRSAGKTFLLALIGVMTFATFMAWGRITQDRPGSALFLVYLVTMVGTASWLTWFSVRRQRDPARLAGVTYRVLATWLVLVGGTTLAIGVATGSPITMFLSLFGVGFGANMWRLALSTERGPQWWRQHHLNGAMLNFMACHDSFLTIGLGTLVPEVREPVPRMLVAVGVTAVALILRVALGRRSALRNAAPARVPAASPTA